MSVTTVYALVAARKLRCRYRVGIGRGRILITDEHIQEFLGKSELKPAPPPVPPPSAAAARICAFPDPFGFLSRFGHVPRVLLNLAIHFGDHRRVAVAEQMSDGHGVHPALMPLSHSLCGSAPRWYFLPSFFSIRQNAQLIASFVHGLPSELSSSGPRDWPQPAARRFPWPSASDRSCGNTSCPSPPWAGTRCGCCAGSKNRASILRISCGRCARLPGQFEQVAEIGLLDRCDDRRRIRPGVTAISLASRAGFFMRASGILVDQSLVLGPAERPFHRRNEIVLRVVRPNGRRASIARVTWIRLQLGDLRGRAGMASTETLDVFLAPSRRCAAALFFSHQSTISVEDFDRPGLYGPGITGCGCVRRAAHQLVIEPLGARPGPDRGGAASCRSGHNSSWVCSPPERLRSLLRHPKNRRMVAGSVQ